MAPPREWDAATYDRISDPQVQWATPVLDRLRPGGVRVVLDAGCGSGRVTEMLLQRLPEARVIAVDGSRRMLDEARRRLASESDRVTFLQADLGLPLPLDEPVDAVVSTATFHWIADHDALFSNLRAVMRPGGQLVVQCGGKGNIDTVVSVLRDLGNEWTPWNFSSAEDARRRLAAAGFVDVEAWLHDEPTTFTSRAEFEPFLETVILGHHLDRIPEVERPALVRAVAAALPSSTIDYVRLNIVATATLKP